MDRLGTPLAVNQQGRYNEEQHSHFIKTVQHVKADFIRLAVWLLVAKG